MSLEEARACLQRARSITVLTGAGISAESGVPTFRGAAGLWKQFRPEDLATLEAFHRDPALVWEWYDWRRRILINVEPNAGHRALVELGKRTARFKLITQNVDGLHQRAGSQPVYEVHGSIWQLRCTGCGRKWFDDSVPLPIPPRCACGALARPDVVWFGENLPAGVWSAAEQAAASCDLFLVIGTSAVVYPAAGLAMAAKSSGAKLIEVNLERTPISDAVDFSIIGRSSEILPELIKNN